MLKSLPRHFITRHRLYAFTAHTTARYTHCTRADVCSTPRCARAYPHLFACAPRTRSSKMIIISEDAIKHLGRIIIRWAHKITRSQLSRDIYLGSKQQWCFPRAGGPVLPHARCLLAPHARMEHAHTVLRMMRGTRPCRVIRARLHYAARAAFAGLPLHLLCAS